MLLKRLELQGFKSFADKTSLDLDSKIVAVVGPNGSGKSNVTDAIRWLLGERDARNLRGGKVDDLIFAGNDKRPRLGLAQATLYFDNTSGFFPVDFTEVSISRRVSRDGESSFFINKAEVRLKDVVDFFAKAKLGARGLTIINQGSSDSFIKSSPAERREMIEEILGLKEYQIKKADSLRKLKNTGINLAQVESSLEELKPHLRFLKKQVARYEGRDVIMKELRDLEDAFYGHRLKSLNEEVTKFRGELGGMAGKIAEAEKGLKEIEGKFQKVKESQPDAAEEYQKIESAKGELLKVRAGLQKDFGRIEAQIEFSAKPAPRADIAKVVFEIRAIATDAMSGADIESIRAKLKEIISRIDAATNPSTVHEENPEKEKLNKLSADIIVKLKKLDGELSDMAKREEQVRLTLGNFNKDFSAAYELLESAKKKVAAFNDDKNRIEFSIEKANVRRDSLLEELKQIGRAPESFGKDPGLKDIGLSEEEMMRRMFKLRGDLASIGEVDETLIKEARETEERYNFLSGQVTDLQKAITDLRVLIKDLDQKIHNDFTKAIGDINAEFDKLMKLTFGGGKAKLVVKDIEEKRLSTVGDEVTADKTPSLTNSRELANETEGENDIAKGIEIEISLPRKRVSGLDVLSGGERTLVSIAVIFALVSVSPPPFLVLDEIDAALDEGNARRCALILKEFSKQTQFVIITHNRATMEAADVLYGVTMNNDGTSKLLSLKLEAAK